MHSFCVLIHYVLVVLLCRPENENILHELIPILPYVIPLIDLHCHEEELHDSVMKSMKTDFVLYSIHLT